MSSDAVPKCQTYSEEARKKIVEFRVGDQGNDCERRLEKTLVSVRSQIKSHNYPYTL